MIVDEVFHPKISVPIIDDAFDIIKIRFSPYFTNKDAFIEKIKEMQPKSTIAVLE